MTLFLAAGNASSASGALGSSGTFHYLLIMALMMTGIYLILSRSNMIKSIIGLNMFQVAVIMFYVSMGKVENGTAPILMNIDTSHDSHHEDAHQKEGHDAQPTTHPAPVPKKAIEKTVKGKHSKDEKKYPTRVEGVIYSNPLPHVLMLTAIVVGVATTALALSLVVRINEAFGTIEEDELEDKEVVS